MRTIDRYWRVVATGFCFATFGLGGLAVTAAMLPFYLLAPRAAWRRHLSRTLVRWLFAVFVGLMSLVGVISVEVRGRAALRRRGQFIVANHPSLIDIVILMSLVQDPDCIVKAGLWRNPFTWGPVSVSGFIRNAGGATLVDEALASLRSGNNLIVFPEGTRTRPGTAIHFQRGAANIAVRGGLRVLPVVISVSAPHLTKGHPWYHVPQRRPHYTLSVLPEIDTAAMVPVDRPPASQVRQLAGRLEEFFAAEIVRHGGSS